MGYEFRQCVGTLGNMSEMLGIIPSKSLPESVKQSQ